MLNMQQTLVLIKPDGVQRGLIGEIIKRFEQRGLKIIGLKLVWVDEKFAEKHYEEHTGKPFFKELTSFLMEGPVTAIVLEGKQCIKFVRKIVGNTKPQDAIPGTIRGDFAHNLGPGGRNMIHASANEPDAKKEIKLWFNNKEIFDYLRADQSHHYKK
ncbi:MAG: nucleoside-diphosphate kinase [Nanoarchaeota archaeon]|nr:nucleoside-diphosphate kinase [Nanoarchaeota archaeon]